MGAGGWTDWTDDLVDVLIAMELAEGDVFFLSRVYLFKGLLGKIHPANNHVESKIRQQLQILRDFGVIEFQEERGKYVLIRLPI